MATKRLLIPGTGGTDFKFPDGSPSGYGLALTIGTLIGSPAMTDELSCDHPTPDVDPFKYSKSTLGLQTDIFPNIVLDGTAYQAVPGSFERFPYDWRIDIRYNAKLLLDHLKTKRSSGERWQIVAHSQGGLVLLAASLLCGRADEFADYVSHIALVACPIFGTLRALGAPIDGSNFGGFASSFFKKASRTWPSIPQMFPQFPCIAGIPDSRVLSSTLWPGASPPWLSLLQRGQNYADWFHRAPFRNLGGDIALRFVFGKSSAANTPIECRFDPQRGLSVGERLVEGDGLVPLIESVQYLNAQGLRGYSDVIKGSTVPDHMMLLNDARVWSVVAGFLEE